MLRTSLLSRFSRILKSLSLVVLSLGLGAFAVGCTVSSTNATGTVKVDWTIASTTDATQCTTYGAANITIQLNDSTGAAYGSATTVACDSFAASIPNVPVGNYTVTGQLLDSTGTAVSTKAGPIAVAVTADETVSAPMDFPMSSFTTVPTSGDGTLEVDWTIATSSDPTECTTYGAVNLVVQISDSNGNPVGNGYMADCTAFATSVPNLPPDTYTFTAQLVDASGNPVSTAINAKSVTITAGQTTTQAVDFPASSFTGPTSGSGDGTLEIDWTIALSMNATECTMYGAANILVQVADSSGNAVGNGYMAPCSDFATSVPDLAPGTYTIVAQLVDTNSQPVSTATTGTTVTITAGQTTTQAIDFPASAFGTGTTAGTGTLEVDWTIATGMDAAQCTAHGAVNVQIFVTDSTGAPYGSTLMAACSTFAASVPDLPVGTYGVALEMVDGSGTSVSTMTGSQMVTIVANQTTTQAFDFPTNSFTM